MYVHTWKHLFGVEGGKGVAFNLFSHNARGGGGRVDGLKMTNLSFSLSLSLCLWRVVLDIVIFLIFKNLSPLQILTKEEETEKKNIKN